MAGIGYDDTPMIPGQDWRVHDSRRPQPRIVTPPTASTQKQAGNPPSDAAVLFDGTDTSKWVGRDGSQAGWKVENDYMEVVPKTGNIQTIDSFGDCHLHVEWAAPVEVKGESQGRGNSGVFLLGLYEVQVLDCYDNPTYADGLTASIYGQFPPLVNACCKPGEWQTYDIFFYSAQFDGDEVVKPTRITVIQNGLPVHINKECLGPTGHRNLAEYKPHGPTGPVMLQDHGDLVRYRNIWIRNMTDYDEQ